MKPSNIKFTLRQLYYFMATAETGSITAASHRASISQAAISTAISHIERELNVQLFVRHHAQGLTPTPAGRALLRDAKQLLKQAEGMYASAVDVSQQLRGELNVGWLSTLAPIVMPELVSTFATAFPETTVRSIVSDQDGLLEGLRRADIEIAVTYDLRITPDIVCVPLATLPPYALFGASHPLARESSVKLSQLAPLPMVLLDTPMGREYFHALFIRNRLQPNIVWSSSQLDVVGTMVANGFGYSLGNVRPRFNAALDGRRLYRVPLRGDMPPVRIGTATLKEFMKTRLVAAFERYCRENISESNIPGMASIDLPKGRRRR